MAWIKGANEMKIDHACLILTPTWIPRYNTALLRIFHIIEYELYVIF